MRLAIGLLAIVTSLTVCAAARAQDPMTYDPRFYEEQDYFNPKNPNSPFARHLRQVKAQKQKQGILVKMENFASNVTTGVTTSASHLVSLLSAANDPNNALPQISTGPGSPLNQPGSLSGSATDAMKPTPPPTPLFSPNMTNYNIFPKLFGPPSPSGPQVYQPK
jgi:hypothetical protein